MKRRGKSWSWVHDSKISFMNLGKGQSQKVLFPVSHEEICMGGDHPSSFDCPLNMQVKMRVEEKVVIDGQEKCFGRMGDRLMIE